MTTHESPWLIHRPKPYTAIGIQRLTCIRAGCSSTAKFQWAICADDNNYRPLCAACDIELNAVVLQWAGCPADLLEKKLLAYVDWVTGGDVDVLSAIPWSPASTKGSPDES